MNSSVIRTQNLRKCYGSVVAINQMNLEIPQGALFGLLGPNGAGKSTTFGILCGWLKPTSGKASILDIPVGRPELFRGRLAAMPQDAAFPRQISVHAQLKHFACLSGLDAKHAHMDADRVLDAVGMRKARNQRGFELSHGMLKRVALAQAILGSPEVLFLDEPTAGLDPSANRRVKDLILSLVPKITVVISSHNLAEVQEICTHGAILNHGQLVASGTLDDLTRKGAEIAIDIREGVPLPQAELYAMFGKEHVRLLDHEILIAFDMKEDVANIIARAVRLLLEHHVPILGIRRGTTLENAFIEATHAIRKS